MVRGLESAFELVLWNSRFLILVAVFLSIVLSIAMLYVASADAVYLVGGIVRYADPHVSGALREQMHDHVVARVASVIDGYLLSAILLIFALGLYELFVSRINAAENSEIAPRLLLIRSLDDLKERLGKVVFLILVVRYFQFALQNTERSSQSLLFLAVGIVLIAIALYLTTRHRRGEPPARTHVTRGIAHVFAPRTSMTRPPEM
jgi:uncharacterized membrane protein YqhA